MGTPTTSIDNLLLGDRARKTYTDIQALAESIQERGIIQPIAVKPLDNGKYKILGGGRRYRALLHIKEINPDNPILASVPFHVVPNVSDDIAEMSIELEENEHRQDFTWQERIQLIQSIHQKMVAKEGDEWSIRKTARLLGRDSSHPRISEDLELAEAISHIPDLAKESSKNDARRKYKRLLEDAEIELARQAVSEQSSDEDDAVNEDMSDENRKKVKKTKLFAKADKSYCIGDAIEGLGKLRAGSMHFAEVDPPYGVDLVGQKSKGSQGIEHYNEVDKDDYPAFFKQVAEKTFRALADDTWSVWWFAPTWHHMVINTLREVGFSVDDIPCIWNKIESGAASNNPEFYLGRSYEPFFLARKGSPILIQRGRRNVFDFKPIPHQKKIHPTERPPELIEEIYKTFLVPNCRIVVPFLGSGASIIAGLKFGASMIKGWDLSETYQRRFYAKLNKALEEDLI